MKRLHLLPLVSCLAFLLSACEELGPDARGEVPTTALQRVGVDRMCVPMFDVANVRSGSDRSLEFALRDGTRWHNTLAEPEGSADAVSLRCRLDGPGHTFLFDTNTDELCAGDLVLVGVRTHQLSRLLGHCRLAGFSRI